MRLVTINAVCLLSLLLPTLAVGGGGTDPVITLGQSVVPLDGPWKFHIGDDHRWAEAAFDDSGWEDMDLRAPPDANDGDVGITPYTAGWGAKGHAGYHGYAWYRFRFTVSPAAGANMALLGPWAVDSAYQVYANGVLLGGIGDFSGAMPVVHGNRYPASFVLPLEMARGGSLVLAVRVWSGAWTGTDGGGIHVAPSVGEQQAIIGQYRLQWLKIFEGYAVDVVPALLFALMALLSLCLWPFDRSDRTYGWLAAALLLSGIQRGNQAFFFLWQIETIQEFVYIIIALVSSLSLAAWIMAWRAWFKVQRPAWLPRVLLVMTVLLILAQVLARPWVFGVSFSHWMSAAPRELITLLRLAFLLALAGIVYQGIRDQGREAWYAVPAVLAIGVVLFSAELATLRVTGIWFPFGVGLSLSEIGSVVFDVFLAALLLRRLWSYAPARHLTELESAP